MSDRTLTITPAQFGRLHNGEVLQVPDSEQRQVTLCGPAAGTASMAGPSVRLTDFELDGLTGDPIDQTVVTAETGPRLAWTLRLKGGVPA